MGADRRKVERRHSQVSVSLDRRAASNRRTRDRRGGERVALELWMEEVSGDDVYFRRTGNVGEGGVYFDKAIPHPLGTMLTLKFSIPGDKEMVVARGEVVSAAGSEHGLGMGVKFITVEGDGQDRLKQYIRTNG